MNKHTPGPWKWSGASELLGGSPPDSVIFATVEYDDGHYSELHIEPADRLLIAAAPELLKSLDEVLSQLFADQLPSAVNERARAAIARATAPATALDKEKADG